jgi:hypothetical protein
MKHFIVVLLILVYSSSSYSQYKNLNAKQENTGLVQSSILQIIFNIKDKKGSSTIFYKTSEFRFRNFTVYLDNNGTNEILIDLYSGGAHCFNFLVAARMINDKFNS